MNTSFPEGSTARAFFSHAIRHVDTVAVRTTGRGPAVILIHGWPFSGVTWRNVLPLLEQHFTCVVVDLAGAGASTWDRRTGFSVDDHARAVQRVADALGLPEYALVAHDTGATVARVLAASDVKRVRGLVLANTEVPGHRPPWIPEYRVSAALPGAAHVWKKTLGRRAFRTSAMGFGGCFWDASLIERELLPVHLQPLLDSTRAIQGILNYLRGIEWSVVDALGEVHQRIAAPVQLVWGGDDVTFPLAEAQRMLPSFRNCAGLHVIKDARFLAHEERPKEFCDAAVPFLQRSLGEALSNYV